MNLVMLWMLFCSPGVKLFLYRQLQWSKRGKVLCSFLEQFVLILVALISVIGRGGEQISRIQIESGCKIQIAPGKPLIVCWVNSFNVKGCCVH